MRTWAYKATGARASLDHTRALAQEYLFLARSVFAEVERVQLVSNVQRVALGDEIHFYYLCRGEVERIGVFEIASPEGHPFEGSFGPEVDRTAIRKVTGGPLLDRLEVTPGYAMDWRLECFCGWPLRKLAQPQREYDPSWYRGQGTLVEITT